MTKREQVIRAFIGKFSGLTNLPTGNVQRDRTTPATPDEGIAVNIQFATDTPNQNTFPMIDWTLVMRVQILARAVNPDSYVDALVQEIHSKIFADVTLGGLAMDITPGPVNLDLDEKGGTVGQIEMRYRILYRTTLMDLSQ